MKAVKNDLKIIVEVVKLHPVVPLSLIELKKIIRCVLGKEKVPIAQLTFVFASDHFLRRLNKKFTTRDRATDVLSFDLSCDIKTGVLFGDVVISVDSALRASGSLRIPIREELIRYVIHGILHLTGYDDTTAFKKNKMWKRQEELITEVLER